MKKFDKLDTELFTKQGARSRTATTRTRRVLSAAFLLAALISAPTVGKSYSLDLSGMTGGKYNDSWGFDVMYNNMSNDDIIAIKLPEIIDEYYCPYSTSLTSITFPKSLTDFIPTSYPEAPALSSISFHPENPVYTTDTEGKSVLTKDGKTIVFVVPSVKTFTIPAGVEHIAECAFIHCGTQLTAITIPNGVKSIGLAAFQGCSSLTSVTLPQSVTSIEVRAFGGCSQLTEVVIPEGVTIIANEAFRGCSRLASVTLPQNVTSIGDGAFYNCKQLATITYGGTVAKWKAVTRGFVWYGNKNNSATLVPATQVQCSDCPAGLDDK
ncbi:MAG: leucine-rich repeat protein [Treponema sp.]|nr:leucine-rich repeat protein [Treponema sp.]